MFNGKGFWERLKKVSGGKNQYEIADLLHISSSAVNQWVNKDRIPTIDHLLALSERFSCSIDYLLGISDQEIKHDIRDVLRQLFIFEYDNQELLMKEYNEKGERKELFGIEYLNIMGITFTNNSITIKDEDNYIHKLFERYENNKTAIHSLPRDLAITLINDITNTHKERYPIPDFIEYQDKSD